MFEQKYKRSMVCEPKNLIAAYMKRAALTFCRVTVYCSHISSSMPGACFKTSRHFNATNKTIIQNISLYKVQLTLSIYQKEFMLFKNTMLPIFKHTLPFNETTTLTILKKLVKGSERDTLKRI